MKGRSISWKLTLWFSLVHMAGFVLFGVFMWFNLRHTLLQGRERTLERRLDRLLDLLDANSQSTSGQRVEHFASFANATGGALMVVLRSDGRYALPPPSAAAAFPWPPFQIPARDQFHLVSLSGQPYLAISRSVRQRWNSSSDTLILRAAAPLESNFALLNSFRDNLLWAVPALLAISACGGYLLSRRALQPVDAITAATRSISLQSLSDRLPVPRTNDELQRLSETCNSMLDRLEAAVTEINRFTADASHELRTPISLIHTRAELALRNPHLDSESSLAFVEILKEARRTTRLLGEMLLLARSEDGNSRLLFEPVSLIEVIEVASRKALPLARERGLNLEVLPPRQEPAPISGDYELLQRLVLILLDNSMKFTPKGGDIRISLQTSGPNQTITVADNGSGIAARDLPHIFGRFYRGDDSRARTDGSGLGLAIAKWIATTHGASISVKSEERQGTEFSVVFSTSPQAAL